MQFRQLKRREVISLLGGAAAWPLAVRAQPGERMRRIGALMAQAEGDPDREIRVAAFAQGLQQLGWIIGGNVRIDYRWATSDVERARYATELVALKPDVLLATSGAIVGALQQATRTVPIVFVTVIDPVGGGWVASLARPGGNATGFASYDFSLSGKWLELLKEIAPGVTRAAVLRDATETAGVGQFAVIQSVASSLGVEVVPVNVGHPDEIGRALTAFARPASSGMVVTASALTLVHRDLIVALADCRCPRFTRDGSTSISGA